MKNNVNGFAIFGLISSAFSIIFGFIIFTLDKGTQPGSYTFGADFYTASYSATQSAAINIALLNETIKTGISFILIIAGLFGIAAFGMKLMHNRTELRVVSSEETLKKIEEELPDL